jgi:hypothetical protein
LLRDLEERLDDDAEDPGQRPLAEVVAHICRDLRLDPNRIPGLAGADWTEPDDTAAPDEAAPDKGAAIGGAAIGGAARAPAATRPQGRWAPLPPPASISPPLVDPLPSRGAVSGAGPP